MSDGEHVYKVVELVGSSKTSLDAEAVRDAVGGSQAMVSVAAGKLQVLDANLRREALIRALDESHGNKRMAAKALGISEATLYRWVHEFGLKAFAGSLRTEPATAGELR